MGNLLLLVSFAQILAGQVRLPGPGGESAASSSMSATFVTGNSVAGCNGGSPACSLSLTGVPVGARTIVFTSSGATSVTGTLGETYTLVQILTAGANEKGWVSTATTQSGTDTVSQSGGYNTMEAAAYSSVTGYDSGATNGTATGNTGPITLSIPGTAGDLTVAWVSGPLTSPVSTACGSMTLRLNDGNILFDVAMASTIYSLSCAIGYSSTWGVIGVSLK